VQIRDLGLQALITDEDSAKRSSAILVLLSHNREAAISLSEGQLSDVITFATAKKTGTNLVRNPKKLVVDFVIE